MTDTRSERLERRDPNPSHNALHMWLRRKYPKTGICEHCSEHNRTDFAAKDHDHYTRDRCDYLELCNGCHAKYDLIEQGVVRGRRKGCTITPEHIEALQAGRRKKRLNTTLSPKELESV